MFKRYDFHIHSMLSEGELVPSEIVQRCSVLGYGGIAICDHADNSNIEFILGSLVPACNELEENFDLHVLAGVELTHIPPALIEKMVKKARKLGAEMVIVHGETIVEPVQKGTNTAALKISGVDILAHPGLITKEEIALASENSVFLELTSRKGHSLANGHVARMAEKTGAELLLNSDAHGPADLITIDQAKKIVTGCGVSDDSVKAVLVDNPIKLLEKR